MSQLSKTAKIAFRDQLRDARAKAVSDAEGFHEVLFAIERLGATILGKQKTLNDYEGKLRNLAECSALSFCLPSKFRHLFMPFDVLYKNLRIARNDALHQGAYARHITSSAVEMSIVLEDALMSDSTVVSDYMVKDIVCAETWQPLAYLRQQMLKNSFSFLPLYKPNLGWSLISDSSIVFALRNSEEDRNDLLGKTLEKAIEKKWIISIDDVIFAKPGESISEVLSKMQNCCHPEHPVLIQHPKEPDKIIGIVTAFDLM